MDYFSKVELARVQFRFSGAGWIAVPHLWAS